MQRSWAWSVFNDFHEHPEGQDGQKAVKNQKRRFDEQGEGELSQESPVDH